jgi:hypothetical protein
MEPSPTFIGFTVLALVQVLNLILMFRKVAGASEKREITALPPNYMTEARCREQHAQAERFEAAQFDGIRKSIEDLAASLDRRNAEGEKRASQLHVRIDGVVAQVSELRGQVNNHIEHGAHNA